jgi:hypothetical protein
MEEAQARSFTGSHRGMRGHDWRGSAVTVNGWTNYPTWAVNLWLGELGTLDDAIVAACDTDPRALRSWIEDNLVYPMDHILPPAELGQDLLGWALDSVDWEELRSHLSPLAYARELGAEHGRAAASWVFDGNTPQDAYARALKGIEDGDPAVLDTLPSADLSGEWADTLTGPQLVADAISYAGGSDDLSDDWFTNICDAYETAYDDAVLDEVSRVARFQTDDAS